jgi:glycosyltransferase involved in cell wall biosynthesis
LRNSAAVIANSEHTAAQIRNLGVEPDVIYPGVDLTRFVPTPRPAERRVLYLGGSAEYKGVDVAQELADTLLGPGIRTIPPEDVPKVIAEHDVVLVPSTREGFGLAAAEAIASGRWVIASATGGLREVVTNGLNGTVVSDGDFARALSQVPDYDPHMVAKTADRFSLTATRMRYANIWGRVRSAAGDRR